MNPEQERTQPWVNKYLPIPTILAFGLLIYILLWGENSAFQSVALHKEIDSLEIVLSAERDTMLHYSDLNSRLSSDRELMEQIVREQYNMKRPSEDVYLIKYE